MLNMKGSCKQMRPETPTCYLLSSEEYHWHLSYYVDIRAVEAPSVTKDGIMAAAMANDNHTPSDALVETT